MKPEASGLPQRFGKYTLLKSLGHGGTAEIFLARDPDHPEPLVIKRLLPELSEELQFLAMLVGEAKVAALLNHPGIVRMHELGKEEGLVYLAMEFVAGWDLHALAKAAGGRLPPAIAARIALAVAEALEHAHQCTDLQGKPLHLVHRDVTPTNVMVTARGEVKLIDFGVAKAETQLTFTQPGVVKGKFRYLAPEQVEQKTLDGRCDLFALGVSLYEASTGERPFDRKQIVDILRAVLFHNPPPPSEVVPGFPPALDQVIRRALVKDRDQRYPDAGAMARELRAAIKAMKGPADLGAYVSDLAKRNPDKLKPPPTLPPEPASKPGARRPELILVNLEEPEPKPRVPQSDPLAEWMTEPLRVRVAQPIELPRRKRTEDPNESWMDRTEIHDDPSLELTPPAHPPRARDDPAWATSLGDGLGDADETTLSGARDRPRARSIAGLLVLGALTIAATWIALQFLVQSAGR